MSTPNGTSSHLHEPALSRSGSLSRCCPPPPETQNPDGCSFLVSDITLPPQQASPNQIESDRSTTNFISVRKTHTLAFSVTKGLTVERGSSCCELPRFPAPSSLIPGLPVFLPVLSVSRVFQILASKLLENQIFILKTKTERRTF